MLSQSSSISKQQSEWTRPQYAESHPGVCSNSSCVPLSSDICQVTSCNAPDKLQPVWWNIQYCNLWLAKEVSSCVACSIECIAISCVLSQFGHMLIYFVSGAAPVRGSGSQVSCIIAKLSDACAVDYTCLFISLLLTVFSCHDHHDHRKLECVFGAAVHPAFPPGVHSPICGYLPASLSRFSPCLPSSHSQHSMHLCHLRHLSRVHAAYRSAFFHAGKKIAPAADGGSQLCW